MVKCSVPGCPTGTGTSKSEKGICCFKFPTDDRLKNKWLKLIGLKSVRDTATVCQKHFISTYFLSDTENVGARNLPLKTPTLRKDAVPTVFDLGPAKKKRDRSSDTSASFKTPRLHSDHGYSMSASLNPPATIVSSSHR